MTLASAAAATTVNPLLSLLVGAFGAAILTVGGGIFGAWRQSRREHKRWVREQRMSAYREFFRALWLVPEDMNRVVTERDNVYIDALAQALATVNMFGPNSMGVSAGNVMTAASELSKAINAKVSADELKAAKSKASAARAVLIATARTELDIEA